MKGSKWWVFSALVAATVLIASGGHRFVPDDVYFYLEIARRIAAGEGSTFDGIRPTNGYHPLWMAVCVAEWLVAGRLGLHGIITVHALVSGLGLWLAFFLVLRNEARGLRGATLLVPATLVVSYAATNAYGSELHSSLPALVGCMALAQRLIVAERHAAGAWRLRLAFGALLGLTCLARLDNVFFCASLALAVAGAALPGSRRRAALDGALIGATALLVLAPYLAWNHERFGHFVPISGAIKGGLAALRGHAWSRLGRQGQLLVTGAWLAMPYFIWRWRTGRGSAMWAAAAIGASVHAAYVVMRMDQIWTWYFCTELVIVAYAAGFALDGLLGARASWGAGVTVALASFHMVRTPLAVLQKDRAEPSAAWYLATASWLDATLPPAAVVVATCSPGSLAYFSSRSVMALDGLTGDFRFHERAAEVGLLNALRELGVTHVVSLGPVSRELDFMAGETARLGHGGEGPEFYVERSRDGQLVASGVGLYSGIVRRHVGRFALQPGRLVGSSFASRKLGVWALPERP
jgi:hypothetical protein